MPSNVTRQMGNEDRETFPRAGSKGWALVAETDRSLVFEISRIPAVIDEEMTSTLCDIARANPLRDVRLCLHAGHDDMLQEMLIALSSGLARRPHRHPERTESLTAIHGRGLAVEYSDLGVVERVTRIGHGGARSIRLASDHFHAIIPLTDLFVIHEVANGPFQPGLSTQYAAWAPSPDDQHAGLEYTWRVLDVAETMDAR